MRQFCFATLPVLFLATPAAADSITWQVPVNVHALMPQVVNVLVSCDAFDAQGKRLGVKDGVSAPLVPDAQGNVVTTVTVKQDLAVGMAKNAVSYRCALKLTPPNGFPEWVGGPTTQGAATAGDIIKPLPGASFIPIVSGKF